MLLLHQKGSQFRTVVSHQLAALQRQETSALIWIFRLLSTSASHSRTRTHQWTRSPSGGSDSPRELVLRISNCVVVQINGSMYSTSDILYGGRAVSHWDRQVIEQSKQPKIPWCSMVTMVGPNTGKNLHKNRQTFENLLNFFKHQSRVNTATGGTTAEFNLSPTPAVSVFARFEPYSADEMWKIISVTASKFCSPDPIPTHIRREACGDRRRRPQPVEGDQRASSFWRAGNHSRRRPNQMWNILTFLLRKACKDRIEDPRCHRVRLADSASPSCPR